ncbi:hypothetical protein M4914_10080 [Streptomyces somaliensis DSM 40738]|uniref:hypothetical protein n=1 Tax=Streptomyces somaliensis TaxID=78355 RepID=UPI0021C3E4FA|nr:hypothetical protein [Streptomyces somaliensis]MCQ0023259.1 hypothetical protein [Streptomyces somaliensis DSM 40738]
MRVQSAGRCPPTAWNPPWRHECNDLHLHGRCVPHPQAPGAATRPASRLGGALRAVRVFAAAAFGVAVLGDYDADAAGVRRR